MVTIVLEEEKIKVWISARIYLIQSTDKKTQTKDFLSRDPEFTMV
jgi:hypothetical protein